MTQVAINYAKVLYQLGITPEDIKEMRHRYLATEKLKQVLVSPVIAKDQKHKLIEKIFDREVQSFLKVLSDYHSMELLPQIVEAYQNVYYKENEVLAATLTFVTKPSEEQVAQFKEYLRKRFLAKRVHFSMKLEPKLVGGFILKIGDLELDWSLQGRLRRLEQKLVNEYH
ncbi:MAG TPA: ATP synthase F1 subunit delta [Lachnospiraceae bacterium]|nr:ATP synthase F1 subunit delta [uncultured Lachnoclostridium sp.]HAU86853.1 ATP synthase F1 subunit delta [Lachnospiraceae bacterium]